MSLPEGRWLEEGDQMASFHVDSEVRQLREVGR